jgi:ABC-type phosphate transport system permease subunit
MTNWMGKSFIIIGIILVLVGVFLLFKDSVPFLRYLGKLPGDINIKRENFSIHFPIVTSIIVSIILSIILYILSKFR